MSLESIFTIKAVALAGEPIFLERPSRNSFATELDFILIKRQAALSSINQRKSKLLDSKQFCASSLQYILLLLLYKNKPQNVISLVAFLIRVGTS